MMGIHHKRQAIGDKCPVIGWGSRTPAVVASQVADAHITSDVRQSDFVPARLIRGREIDDLLPTGPYGGFV
jgi:hypothetical protein